MPNEISYDDLIQTDTFNGLEKKRKLEVFDHYHGKDGSLDTIRKKEDLVRGHNEVHESRSDNELAAKNLEALEESRTNVAIGGDPKEEAVKYNEARKKIAVQHRVLQERRTNALGAARGLSSSQKAFKEKYVDFADIGGDGFIFDSTEHDEAKAHIADQEKAFADLGKGADSDIAMQDALRLEESKGAIVDSYGEFRLKNAEDLILGGGVVEDMISKLDAPSSYKASYIKGLPKMRENLIRSMFKNATDHGSVIRDGDGYALNRAFGLRGQASAASDYLTKNPAGVALSMGIFKTASDLFGHESETEDRTTNIPNDLEEGKITFAQMEKAVLDQIKQSENLFVSLGANLEEGILTETQSKFMTLAQLATYGETGAEVDGFVDAFGAGNDNVNSYSRFVKKGITRETLETSARIIPQILLTRKVGHARYASSMKKYADASKAAKSASRAATAVGATESMFANMREVLDVDPNAEGEALAVGLIGFGVTFLTTSAFNKIPDAGGLENFKKTALSKSATHKEALMASFKKIGLGVVGEGAEEFIDEFLNGLVTSTYTGATMEQIVHGALIGAYSGALFGGAPAVKGTAKGLRQNYGDTFNDNNKAVVFDGEGYKAALQSKTNTLIKNHHERTAEILASKALTPASDAVFAEQRATVLQEDIAELETELSEEFNRDGETKSPTTVQKVLGAKNPSDRKVLQAEARLGAAVEVRDNAKEALKEADQAGVVFSGSEVNNVEVKNLSDAARDAYDNYTAAEGAVQNADSNYQAAKTEQAETLKAEKDAKEASKVKDAPDATSAPVDPSDTSTKPAAETKKPKQKALDPKKLKSAGEENTKQKGSFNDRQFGGNEKFSSVITDEDQKVLKPDGIISDEGSTTHGLLKKITSVESKVRPNWETGNIGEAGQDGNAKVKESTSLNTLKTVKADIAKKLASNDITQEQADALNRTADRARALVENVHREDGSAIIDNYKGAAKVQAQQTIAELGNLNTDSDTRPLSMREEEAATAPAEPTTKTPKSETKKPKPEPKAPKPTASEQKAVINAELKKLGVAPPNARKSVVTHQKILDDAIAAKAKADAVTPPPVMPDPVVEPEATEKPTKERLDDIRKMQSDMILNRFLTENFHAYIDAAARGEDIGRIIASSYKSPYTSNADQAADGFDSNMAIATIEQYRADTIHGRRSTEIDFTNASWFTGETKAFDLNKMPAMEFMELYKEIMDSVKTSMESGAANRDILGFDPSIKDFFAHFAYRHASMDLNAAITSREAGDFEQDILNRYKPVNHSRRTARATRVLARNVSTDKGTLAKVEALVNMVADTSVFDRIEIVDSKDPIIRTTPIENDKGGFDTVLQVSEAGLQHNSKALVKIQGFELDLIRRKKKKSPKRSDIHSFRILKAIEEEVHHAGVVEHMSQKELLALGTKALSSPQLISLFNSSYLQESGITKNDTFSALFNPRPREVSKGKVEYYIDKNIVDPTKLTKKQEKAAEALAVEILGIIGQQARSGLAHGDVLKVLLGVNSSSKPSITKYLKGIRDVADHVTPNEDLTDVLKVSGFDSVARNVDYLLEVKYGWVPVQQDFLADKGGVPLHSVYDHRAMNPLKPASRASLLEKMGDESHVNEYLGMVRSLNEFYELGDVSQRGFVETANKMISLINRYHNNPDKYRTDEDSQGDFKLTRLGVDFVGEFIAAKADFVDVVRTHTLTKKKSNKFDRTLEKQMNAQDGLRKSLVENFDVGFAEVKLTLGDEVAGALETITNMNSAVAVHYGHGRKQGTSVARFDANSMTWEVNVDSSHFHVDSKNEQSRKTRGVVMPTYAELTAAVKTLNDSDFAKNALNAVNSSKVNTSSLWLGVDALLDANIAAGVTSGITSAEAKDLSLVRQKFDAVSVNNGMTIDSFLNIFNEPISGDYSAAAFEGKEGKASTIETETIPINPSFDDPVDAVKAHLRSRNLTYDAETVSVDEIAGTIEFTRHKKVIEFFPPQHQKKIRKVISDHKNSRQNAGALRTAIIATNPDKVGSEFIPPELHEKELNAYIGRNSEVDTLVADLAPLVDSDKLFDTMNQSINGTFEIGVSPQMVSMAHDSRALYAKSVSGLLALNNTIDKEVGILENRITRLKIVRTNTATPPKGSDAEARPTPMLDKEIVELGDEIKLQGNKKIANESQISKFRATITSIGTFIDANASLVEQWGGYMRVKYHRSENDLLHNEDLLRYGDHFTNGSYDRAKNQFSVDGYQLSSQNSETTSSEKNKRMFERFTSPFKPRLAKLMKDAVSAPDTDVEFEIFLRRNDQFGVLFGGEINPDTNRTDLTQRSMISPSLKALNRSAARSYTTEKMARNFPVPVDINGSNVEILSELNPNYFKNLISFYAEIDARTAALSDTNPEFAEGFKKASPIYGHQSKLLSAASSLKNDFDTKLIGLIKVNEDGSVDSSKFEAAYKNQLNEDPTGVVDAFVADLKKFTRQIANVNSDLRESTSTVRKEALGSVEYYIQEIENAKRGRDIILPSTVDFSRWIEEKWPRTYEAYALSSKIDNQNDKLSQEEMFELNKLRDAKLKTAEGHDKARLESALYVYVKYYEHPFINLGLLDSHIYGADMSRLDKLMDIFGKLQTHEVRGHTSEATAFQKANITGSLSIFNTSSDLVSFNRELDGGELKLRPDGEFDKQAYRDSVTLDLTRSTQIANNILVSEPEIKPPSDYNPFKANQNSPYNSIDWDVYAKKHPAYTKDLLRDAFLEFRSLEDSVEFNTFIDSYAEGFMDFTSFNDELGKIGRKLSPVEAELLASYRKAARTELELNEKIDANSKSNELLHRVNIGERESEGTHLDYSQTVELMDYVAKLSDARVDVRPLSDVLKMSSKASGSTLEGAYGQIGSLMSESFSHVPIFTFDDSGLSNELKGKNTSVLITDDVGELVGVFLNKNPSVGKAGLDTGLQSIISDLSFYALKKGFKDTTGESGVSDVLRKRLADVKSDLDQSMLYSSKDGYVEYAVNLALDKFSDQLDVDFTRDEFIEKAETFFQHAFDNKRFNTLGSLAKFAGSKSFFDEVHKSSIVKGVGIDVLAVNTELVSNPDFEGGVFTAMSDVEFLHGMVFDPTFQQALELLPVTKSSLGTMFKDILTPEASKIGQDLYDGFAHYREAEVFEAENVDEVSRDDAVQEDDITDSEGNTLDIEGAATDLQNNFDNKLPVDDLNNEEDLTDVDSITEIEGSLSSVNQGELDPWLRIAYGRDDGNQGDRTPRYKVTRVDQGTNTPAVDHVRDMQTELGINPFSTDMLALGVSILATMNPSNAAVESVDSFATDKRVIGRKGSFAGSSSDTTSPFKGRDVNLLDFYDGTAEAKIKGDLLMYGRNATYKHAVMSDEDPKYDGKSASGSIEEITKTRESKLDFVNGNFRISKDGNDILVLPTYGVLTDLDREHADILTDNARAKDGIGKDGGKTAFERAVIENGKTQELYQDSIDTLRRDKFDAELKFADLQRSIDNLIGSTAWIPTDNADVDTNADERAELVRHISEDLNYPQISTLVDSNNKINEENEAFFIKNFDRVLDTYNRTIQELDVLIGRKELGLRNHLSDALNRGIIDTTSYPMSEDIFYEQLKNDNLLYFYEERVRREAKAVRDNALHNPEDSPVIGRHAIGPESSFAVYARSKMAKGESFVDAFTEYYESANPSDDIHYHQPMTKLHQFYKDEVHRGVYVGSENSDFKNPKNLRTSSFVVNAAGGSTAPVAGDGLGVDLGGVSRSPAALTTQQNVLDGLYANNADYASFASMSTPPPFVSGINKMIASLSEYHSSGVARFDQRVEIETILGLAYVGDIKGFLSKATPMLGDLFGHNFASLVHTGMNPKWKGKQFKANYASTLHQDSKISMMLAKEGVARELGLTVMGIMDLGMGVNGGRNGYHIKTKAAEKKFNDLIYKKNTGIGEKEASRAYMASLMPQYVVGLTVDVDGVAVPVSARDQINNNIARVKEGLIWNKDKARYNELISVVETFMASPEAAALDDGKLGGELNNELKSFLAPKEYAFIEEIRNYFDEQMKEQKFLASIHGQSEEAYARLKQDVANFTPWMSISSTSNNNEDTTSDGATSAFAALATGAAGRPVYGTPAGELQTNALSAIMGAAKKSLYLTNTALEYDLMEAMFGSKFNANNVGVKTFYTGGQKVGSSHARGDMMSTLSEFYRNEVDIQLTNDRRVVYDRGLAVKLAKKSSRVSHRASLTGPTQFLKQSMTGIVGELASDPAKMFKFTKNLVKVTGIGTTALWDSSEGNYYNKIRQVMAFGAPHLIDRAPNGMEELDRRMSKLAKSSEDTAGDTAKRYGRTVENILALPQEGLLKLLVTVPDAALVHAIYATEIESQIRGGLDAAIKNPEKYSKELTMARVNVEGIMAQSDSSKKGKMFQPSPKDWVEFGRMMLIPWSNQLVSMGADLRSAHSMLRHGDKKARGRAWRTYKNFVAQQFTYHNLGMGALLYWTGVMMSKGDNDDEERKDALIVQESIKSYAAQYHYYLPDPYTKEEYMGRMLFGTLGDSLAIVSPWLGLSEPKYITEQAINYAQEVIATRTDTGYAPRYEDKDEKGLKTYDPRHYDGGGFFEGLLDRQGGTLATPMHIFNTASTYAHSDIPIQVDKLDLLNLYMATGGDRNQRSGILKTIQRRTSKAIETKKTPAFTHGLLRNSTERAPVGHMKHESLGGWDNIPANGSSARVLSLTKKGLSSKPSAYKEIKGLDIKYGAGYRNDGDSFITSEGIFRLYNVDAMEKDYDGTKVSDMKHYNATKARRGDRIAIGWAAREFVDQLFLNGKVDIYTQNKNLVHPKGKQNRPIYSDRQWAFARVRYEGKTYDLSTLLISKGLAIQSNVGDPPRTTPSGMSWESYTSSLMDAQNYAKKNRLGIWKYSEFIK